MPGKVEIENIEEKRQQVGIDDVELRAEIRDLKVGDVVKLTFMASAGSFESVPVRITHIRGGAFRGKLGWRALTIPQGKIVEFTFTHIHSVLKKHTVHV